MRVVQTVLNRGPMVVIEKICPGVVGKLGNGSVTVDSIELSAGLTKIRHTSMFPSRAASVPQSQLL